MNPTRPCPRCGRQNPGAISFCPACGENLASPAKRHGWKLLFGAFAVIVGVLWASAIYTQTGRQAGQSQPPLQPFASSNQPPAAPVPEPAGLTASDHLAEARRALADGYKPNKDPKKAAWGEVAAARWHLKSINRDAPEYGEAQELLKEVARRERQIELASKPPAAVVEPSAEAAEVSKPDDNDVGHETSAQDKSSALPAAPATSQPARGVTTARPQAPARSGGGSSDDYYTNVEGVRVRRPTFSESVPAGASAQCRDGSYSFSRNRRGTCSHHGGVARWL